MKKKVCFLVAVFLSILMIVWAIDLLEEESREEDFRERIFDPIQGLLDQCKGTKNLSRKLVKRIEDLVDDSAALKDNLMPRIGGLNSKVSLAVDFGIQVRRLRCD